MPFIMWMCVCFRYKYVDPDTGIEYAQASSEGSNEVYPIHIVPENKDGIQGSCEFFKERTDVTKDIRTKSLTALVSLDEALQRLVGLQPTVCPHFSSPQLSKCNKFV